MNNPQEIMDRLREVLEEFGVDPDRQGASISVSTSVRFDSNGNKRHRAQWDVQFDLSKEG